MSGPLLYNSFEFSFMTEEMTMTATTRTLDHNALESTLCVVFELGEGRWKLTPWRLKVLRRTVAAAPAPARDRPRLDPRHLVLRQPQTPRHGLHAGLVQPVDGERLEQRRGPRALLGHRYRRLAHAVRLARHARGPRDRDGAVLHGVQVPPASLATTVVTPAHRLTDAAAGRPLERSSTQMRTSPAS